MTIAQMLIARKVWLFSEEAPYVNSNIDTS